jgi:hypothetical protein
MQTGMSGGHAIRADARPCSRRVAEVMAVLSLLVGSTPSCVRGSNKPKGRMLPETLVLRVDEVVVSPSRPGTNETWDGPDVEDDPAAGCKLLALGAALANPVLGKGLDSLCSFSHAPQRERDPASPDLQVRLSAGDAAGYLSTVEPDTVRAVFGYEFTLPLAAIPPEGVRMDVLDIDVGKKPELIGSTRISRADLEQAFLSPTQLLTLHDDAVQKLEIVIGAYAPLSIPEARLSASSKPTAIGSRKIIAGEVVNLRASGVYTVGSWYDTKIGPAGYPGNDARSYNFSDAPFGDAPHACGIALIGATESVEGVVVGTGRIFPAVLSGTLRVGVNDTDPANNSGWLSFVGSSRAPTPTEWLAGASGNRVVPPGVNP